MMNMLRRVLTRRSPLGRLETVAWATCALSLVSGRATHAAQTAQPSPPRIAINDNRVAAGDVADGTLTIRLEARSGEWRPDGDDAQGVVVNAFAVEGRALQVPAPLIRVVEGTEIRAFVRNGLEGSPLFMRGLYSRPGTIAAAPVMVPPGETREIRFVAGRPGTYYYWASTDATTPMPQRAGPDTQLSGALVVEPRGGPSQPERVLVIGNWINGGALGSPDRRLRFVINGRSWPHTERLQYQVGDVVRMRLINAGASVHPMHLHGFYFNVDSRGDEREDLIFPRDSSPHLVVTERLAAGRTFALTWKPTRPGNWLFHCHDSVHLVHGGRSTAVRGPRPTSTAMSKIMRWR